MNTLLWNASVQRAQVVFRAALMALARPAQPITLPFDLALPPQSGKIALPEELPPELAVLALTFCDNEISVWIDPEMDTEAVREWFRFHCGTKLAPRPEEAQFAFVSRPETLPSLGVFHQGEAAYPDRSTTILLGGVSFGNDGTPFLASGPGIAGLCEFICAMPEAFPVEWKNNHAAYPLGVDMLLSGQGCLAGLPRSTNLEVPQCM